MRLSGNQDGVCLNELSSSARAYCSTEAPRTLSACVWVVGRDAPGYRFSCNPGLPSKIGEEIM